MERREFLKLSAVSIVSLFGGAVVDRFFFPKSSSCPASLPEGSIVLSKDEFGQLIASKNADDLQAAFATIEQDKDNQIAILRAELEACKEKETPTSTSTPTPGTETSTPTPISCGSTATPTATQTETSVPMPTPTATRRPENPPNPPESTKKPPHEKGPDPDNGDGRGTGDSGNPGTINNPAGPEG